MSAKHQIGLRSNEPESLLSFASLVERLSWLATHRSNAIAARFQADSSGKADQLTYAEFDLAARAVAASLQERALGGQRVVLMLPTGRDYLVAFFGCLYAGCVAVPSFPPRPNRSEERQSAIVSDSHPAAVIVSRLPEAGNANHCVEMLDLNQLYQGNPAKWVDKNVTSDQLAMLQYTSGSTARPKGVMLSHGNLLHNIQMLIEALEPDDDTLGLSWLPLFHDMGLIGGALTPICAGFPIILMSPESFLMRPIRWLSAISDHGVNWSVAPNFAYDYCVSKIKEEQRDSLDLSCWRAAIVGAEPVRRNTLEEFASYFGSSGFSISSFYPCYGLAEATLFVTGGAHDAAPIVETYAPNSASAPAGLQKKGAVDVVGCGWPRCDQEIAIVDEQGREISATGDVGEIWVSGPNVAQGYWNNAEATSETFAMMPEGDDRLFLRTGDLGYCSGDELFIVGRTKNMIVVAGRNIHLEDIEHTVCGAHPRLSPGRCAAFDIEDQQAEKLGVIIELDRKVLADLHKDPEVASGVVLAEEILTAVGAAVTSVHEVPIHDVVFAKAGAISRTSSGKIQRNVCRDRYLSGAFDKEAGESGVEGQN